MKPLCSKKYWKKRRKRKKAEEKAAARQEMLNMDDTAIDMTKNDRLASSTLRSLFESSGE